MNTEFEYKGFLIKLETKDNGHVLCFVYNQNGDYIEGYSVPQNIISQGDDAIILYAKSYIEFNLNC